MKKNTKKSPKKVKRSSFVADIKSKRKTVTKIIRKSTTGKRKSVGPALEKFEGNPILRPNSENKWESKATFNPTAICADGKVHLMYRAVGDNDSSVVGYASSEDGLNIDERLRQPAYVQIGKSPRLAERYPANWFHVSTNYSSGGGWSGGCEDPRITLLDDKVYLIFTTFDGWDSLGLAMTSIKLEDFLDKKWKWARPVFIAEPRPGGQNFKNWVLFPEKINGKFAILHSIYPDILIHYFDKLEEFDGKHFIESRLRSDERRKDAWDSWMRGTGPAPIKTKYGWLIFYHAMDDADPNKYKLGAMILDLKDPTKILYRAKSPVLEPEEDYENSGFKSGVVYACGAVVKDGRLLVYYGGADMVGCVAEANLDEFLQEMISTGKTRLKKGQKVY